MSRLKELKINKIFLIDCKQPWLADLTMVIILFFLKIKNKWSLHIEPEKKNAFKYPKDPSAVFPQYKKQPLVDFRSSSIPFAGTEFSGAYRKKNKETEVNETKEIEIEEIKEDSQQEEGSLNEDEIQDNDLEKDFNKFKISSKKKRIKKSSQEKEIIYLEEKKVKKIKEKKKKERSCRKSRKNMNF